MTWIRTVPLSEASESLLQALTALQSLYPKEYTEPVHKAERSEASGAQMADIIASHSLIPDALNHAFATFRSLMSPEPPPARDHHHHGLAHQPLPLLN
jgi:hypothetical protein